MKTTGSIAQQVFNHCSYGGVSLKQAGIYDSEQFYFWKSGSNGNQAVFIDGSTIIINDSDECLAIGPQETHKKGI